MSLPTGVITVYVMPTVEEVARAAVELHGAQLPMGTVAYSVYDDQSIVGTGSQQLCGSLAHELVHLMIRGTFGNSPAWLEEGIASEVAVGTPLAKQVRFAPSWRDDMLKAQWNLRPTVKELISSGWPAFAARKQVDMQKVAATHAMAAAFVRYLDAKQMLGDTYRACRDRHLAPDLTVARSYADILQDVTGMTPGALDKDFVKWFTGNVSVAH